MNPNFRFFPVVGRPFAITICISLVITPEVNLKVEEKR